MTRSKLIASGAVIALGWFAFMVVQALAVFGAMYVILKVVM